MLTQLYRGLVVQHLSGVRDLRCRSYVYGGIRRHLITPMFDLQETIAEQLASDTNGAGTDAE